MKQTGIKRILHSLTLLLLLCTLIGAGTLSVHAATPYSVNGRLSVKGSKIVNSKGKTFVIKGVSTHGIAWYPDYINKAAFKEMRDKWGVNTIRLAMYTAEYNGYCSGGNKAELKKLIDKGVTYASDLGMYVIIDWHILSDGNPLTNKTSAIAFFKEIAKKYASRGNVMYEICNEPNGSGGSWKNIKSYAGSVIKTIRAVNSKAIIIVGTPTWSQDVDVAANSKITGYSNIAYAFHFYAGTHKDALRTKLTTAVNQGLPVIVTEFGITDASGNGSVNKTEGNKWMSLLDSKGIGRVCWNLSNKNESSALIKSSVTKTSGWTYSNLSAQGQWLTKAYGGSIAKSGGVNYTCSTAAFAPLPPSIFVTPYGQTSGGSSSGSSDSSGSSGSTSGSASSGTVTLKPTASETNSWQSGEVYSTQYTVSVENTGKKTASKWTVTINFNRSFTCSNLWNGTYSVSGKKMTLKPVEWNTELKPGDKAEIGFILDSDANVSVSSISVTAS